MAKDLLATLKREKLILDWREKQQARAAVQQTIRQRYANLPTTYPVDLRKQKADLTYCHIYDSYKGAGQSITNITRIQSQTAKISPRPPSSKTSSTPRTTLASLLPNALVPHEADEYFPVLALNSKKEEKKLR